MPTTNYNFTTISGSDTIDIVNAINKPLQEIDTALKKIADSIPEIPEIPTFEKGTTYDQLNQNGFLYQQNS